MALAFIIGSSGLAFVTSSSVSNINNTSQASIVYLLNHHANFQTTKRVTFNKGDHLGININELGFKAEYYSFKVE